MTAQGSSHAPADGPASDPGVAGVDAAAVADAVHITWLGHATVLIDVGGHRIITDPALTRRLAHLVRRAPAPDVGPVDTVLISHLHMDHLHRRSLQQVATRATVVVPDGGHGLVRGVGAARVDGVRVGDRIELGPLGDSDTDVSIDVVHADHSCRRGPHTRQAAEPVGFVIRIGERTIYFAGDTGLFDGMADLGPIDVALLPIWGWGSSLGTRHLDPVTAVTAVERIAPERLVPIHWGTYSPARAGRGAPAWLDSPLEALRAELTARGHEHRLHALPPGGSMTLHPASSEAEGSGGRDAPRR